MGLPFYLISCGGIALCIAFARAESFRDFSVVWIGMHTPSVCHQVDFVNNDVQCNATQYKEAKETEEPQKRSKCKCLFPEADSFLLSRVIRDRCIDRVFQSINRDIIHTYEINPNFLDFFLIPLLSNIIIEKNKEIHMPECRKFLYQIKYI